MRGALMNATLDRWALGDGAGMIAKDFGRKPIWVKQTVRRARARGDARAVSHSDAPAGSALWRSRYIRRGRWWAFRV